MIIVFVILGTTYEFLLVVHKEICCRKQIRNVKEWIL